MQTHKELPVDLIIEFERLLEAMTERTDFEKDIVHVMDNLGSNIDKIEMGYNNLKRVYTTAIARLKKSGGKDKEIESRSLNADFIDQFDKDSRMSKTSIAKLCGRSEAWVHNHKSEFSQSSKGINVRSFLKWLKQNHIACYNTFTANYRG